MVEKYNYCLPEFQKGLLPFGGLAQEMIYLQNLIIKRNATSRSAEFPVELCLFAQKRLSPGASLEQCFLDTFICCVSVQKCLYLCCCLSERAGRISQVE